MSDTPRTDKAEYRQPDSEPAEPLGMVDVEFARQLESELNEANERLQRLDDALEAYRHAYTSMRRWIKRADLDKAKETKP